MPDFSNTLIIGISARTLFDLEEENEIFHSQGFEIYRKLQREREKDILKPGTGFYLVKALLGLNKLSSSTRLVEVIVMSSNSPETGVRVWNSITELQLDITRSAFTGGGKISGYMEAFEIDLFLSKSETDVQEVIDSKTAAAALVLEPPTNFISEEETVRIAFDADAVLFSDESEQIYKAQGMAAFHQNESDNVNIPLNEGPHGKLLKSLAQIQKHMDPNVEINPLRLAIVTARSSPSHMRVINTLRAWEVYVDEAFFLGGMSKGKILKAFNAHIYFDDQDVHLQGTKEYVPSAKVFYGSDSPLNPANIKRDENNLEEK